MFKVQTKFVTFFTLVLFAFNLKALPLYISIDTQELDSLSIYEIDFLRKSTFEAIFSSNSFEILLNEKVVKFPKGEVYFRINLNSKKTSENKFALEFSLEEIPSGEILNKVSAFKVDKEKIQLKSRKLLNELLFEEYNLDLNGKPEAHIKENILRAINSAKERNEQSRKSGNQDRQKNDLKSDSNDEGEDLIEPPVKEEDVIKNNEEPPKRKDKPNTSKTNNFESPVLDLTKTAVAQEKSRPFQLTLKSKYEFAIGYEKENANANAVIDTEATLKTVTNTTLVSLGLLSNIKVEEWNKYFTYGFIVTKIISEDTYAIPARYSAIIKYNQHLWENFMSLNFVIEYQKFSFVSLTQRGGGLQTFSNNALWIGGELSAEFLLLNKATTLGLGFFRTLVGTSDQSNIGDSVVVDGNKLEGYVKSDITKKIGALIKYGNVSFSSLSDSSFNTTHNVASVNLTYRYE